MYHEPTTVSEGTSSKDAAASISSLMQHIRRLSVVLESSCLFRRKSRQSRRMNNGSFHSYFPVHVLLLAEDVLHIHEGHDILEREEEIVERNEDDGHRPSHRTLVVISIDVMKTFQSRPQQEFSLLGLLFRILVEETFLRRRKDAHMLWKDCPRNVEWQTILKHSAQ